MKVWWSRLFSYLICTILGVGLVSCIASSSTQNQATAVILTRSPVGTQTESAQVTTIPTPVLTATLETVPQVPSALPTDFPSSEPMLAICDPQWERQRVTLPDLSSLQWQEITSEVRQLPALDYRVIPIELSPNGRWLVIGLETNRLQAEAAKAVIDTQDNSHWWLDQEAFLTAEFLPDIDWLNEDQLLWVEQGQLFIGDGENRHPLPSPSPESFSWAWYGVDDIAFARTEQASDLWRVNVVSNEWEQVPQGEGSGNYLFMSRDGHYALSLQDHQLWRIPTQMGTSAVPIGQLEVDFVGHGGGISQPVQLGHTPYWLMGLTITLEEIEKGIWAEFMMDERDARVLAAADFLLPEDDYPIDFTASSDGAWWAVSLWGSEPFQQKGVYVASADDLTNGRIVEGVSVVGWHTNPPAVIFQDETTGALSIDALPIMDEPAPYILNSARLPLVTAVPNRLFAVDVTSPATLLQFDVRGNLLDKLDLSATYDAITLINGTTDRVYLSVTTLPQVNDNNCTFGLVEWKIGTSAASTP